LSWIDGLQHFVDVFLSKKERMRKEDDEVGK
jgi:hypothetical protein